MSGKAAQAGLFEAVPAGLADGFAASFVLVIWSHITHSLVQPDRVVVHPASSTSPPPPSNPQGPTTRPTPVVTRPPGTCTPETPGQSTFPGLTCAHILRKSGPTVIPIAQVARSTACRARHGLLGRLCSVERLLGTGRRRASPRYRYRVTPDESREKLRTRQRPTVQDVARVAGVSPMTVSRVLSGGQKVGDELRAQVIEAVQALGYRRNESARSLRNQQSGLIGVTITNVANPYYSELLLGVEEVAAAVGRRVLVGNSSEDEAKEAQIVSDFLSRQVEGLIVVPTDGREAHLEPDSLGGVPLVLASRLVPGLAVDAVLISDFEGAFAATAALLDEGHTRVAFLGHRLTMFTGRRRLEGFLGAFDARGVDVNEALIRTAPGSATSPEEAMLSLLDLEEPPTAVFSGNNRNTMGMLRALMVRGIPRDAIRLAAFDNFEMATLLPYHLTIVDHDPRELGRVAARMLCDRFAAEGQDLAPRTVERPTSLIEMGA